MILGTGIDCVDIVRFNHWHKKSLEELAHMFAPAEITYCLENTIKSAERFAVRFAAKEAFAKAFAAWQNRITPLSLICKAVHVTKNAQNVPCLSIEWIALNAPHGAICHLTLSHSNTVAIAQVIITQ